MSIFYSLLVTFFISCCHADIAIMAGYNQYNLSSNGPFTPIANSVSVGNTQSTSIKMPDGLEGTTYAIAIDPITGMVLYGGEDDNNQPFLLKGYVVSNDVSIISFPPNTPTGQINAIAIDSKGNAIIGGTNSNSGASYVFKLPYGESRTTAITLDIPYCDINSVAIGQDDVAILGGTNNSSPNNPVIYTLAPGSTIASAVSLPDSTFHGFIQTISILPNGTALLAGRNITADNGLIYSLSPGSLSASAISVPGSGDGGYINDIGVTSTGRAFFVGGTSGVSLIYDLPLGATSASILPQQVSDSGFFNSIGVGSDDTAVLGGQSITQTPLINKIAPGGSEATFVEIPFQFEGTIYSVVIGSENIAILGGSYATNFYQSFIYSLSTSATGATLLLTPPSFSPTSILLCGAIYCCDNNYSLNYFRPYYYSGQDEAINLLQQAGL